MKEKIIYQGKEFSLKIIKRKILQKEIKKEIVVYPKTVAILPLIDKDKIILVRQYRFPTKRELWEIPAGKLKRGERPEIGAKRELKEETGYEAGKLKKIKEFYLSPGYSTEYMYLFKATSLKKGKQSLDEDEVIKEVKIFNLKEILKMIENKKIIDAKTILAIFLQTKSFNQNSRFHEIWKSSKKKAKIERKNLEIVGGKRSGEVSSTPKRSNPKF